MSIERVTYEIIDNKMLTLAKRWAFFVNFTKSLRMFERILGFVSLDGWHCPPNWVHCQLDNKSNPILLAQLYQNISHFSGSKIA